MRTEGLPSYVCVILLLWHVAGVRAEYKDCKQYVEPQYVSSAV